jgi:beta-glucuronidase
LLLIVLCTIINGQANFIQNIKARNIQNLDGRWHYIIDPYETGFVGFQGKKADENGLSGFFENRQQHSKSE